jgi:hypothetical protein
MIVREQHPLSRRRTRGAGSRGLSLYLEGVQRADAYVRAVIAADGADGPRAQPIDGIAARLRAGFSHSAQQRARAVEQVMLQSPNSFAMQLLCALALAHAESAVRIPSRPSADDGPLLRTALDVLVKSATEYPDVVRVQAQYTLPDYASHGRTRFFPDVVRVQAQYTLRWAVSAIRHGELMRERARELQRLQRRAQGRWNWSVFPTRRPWAAGSRPKTD